jgi:AcrR family transcriptional regulator
MPKQPPDKSRPLPRGPHALSREEVAQAQRRRLLVAMVECVAEKGYVQTSVADVLACSGVSRATFYQLFSDKEACFREAYRESAAQLTSALVSGLHSDAVNPDEPLRRLGRILEIYLDTLANEPAFARTFLVEVYAAGDQANAQRQASIEAFIDLIKTILHGRLRLDASEQDQRFAIKLLVHGVISMATSMIGSGNTARLPELRRPLLNLAEQLIK